MNSYQNVLTIFMMLLTVIYSMGQEFEEQREFNYYENSQIQYNEAKLHYYNTYKVVEGEQTVIEYITDNGGDPGNHSKAKTVIAFHIDSKSKKFELKDEEMWEHGGIYMQACECQDIGIHPLNRGQIKGEKMKDGNWRVDINIFVKGRVTGKEYHFEFSRDYKLSKN